MAKLKPYSKYKDSGVDWLGEIPEGWKVNRTKVLFKPIDERSKDGSEQLLSVSEHVGVKPRNQLKITMFQAESYEGYKLCQKGDLVINSLWAWKRGLGFSEYSGIVSTAYGVYRPKKSASIDYKFFHYLYRTKKYVDQLYIASRGIWKSRMQLSDSSFLNILVAYPEFETQIKARKYLEYKEKDIDKYIKKLKKEIALLKEHRQKIISQAITCGLDENGKLRKKPEWDEGKAVPKGWKNSGVEWLGLIPEKWDTRKLGYLGMFKKGKGISKDSITDQGEPVILYGDIYTKYEVQTEKLLRKAPSAVIQDAEEIIKHDLLFTGSGETKEEIGKCVTYTGIEKGYAGGDVIIFRPNSLINSIFLSYLMYSSKYLAIKANLAKGQIIVHIYSSGLKNIEILLPSKDEQENIARYLDRISENTTRQINEITKQIDFIKEYKQSLISKVVTGKIDVRNINNNLSED